MGLCSSSSSTATMSPEERQAMKEEHMRSIAIERTNQIDHEADLEIKKLLLLGAGESGKSTFFKQLVDLYDIGFSDKEIAEYIPVVHYNILQGMHAICSQLDILGLVLRVQNEPFRNLILSCDIRAPIDKEICLAVKSLWSDPAVQAAFDRRSEFQLIDSCEYFFNKIDQVLKENYRPSKQDILRARARTSGITDTSFKVSDRVKFKIFDVGGQRNERRKWIHCFEGVTALIFFAAINEYDQMLFEDGSVNRVTEALNLFEEVVNMKWFDRSSVILFLNKRDLFEEKLRRVPLGNYFPDYTGNNEFEESWRFLASKFERRNLNPGKEIYMHVTCVLDDQNVMFVFDSVKDMLTRAELAKAGLLM